MYCFRYKDWSFIKTPTNMHFLKAEKFQAKSFFSQEGFHHWAISAPICYPGGLSPPIYIPDTSNVVSSKLSFVSRGDGELRVEICFQRLSGNHQRLWSGLNLLVGNTLDMFRNGPRLQTMKDKSQKQLHRVSVEISPNPREFVLSTLPPLENTKKNSCPCWLSGVFSQCLLSFQEWI